MQCNLYKVFKSPNCSPAINTPYMYIWYTLLHSRGSPFSQIKDWHIPTDAFGHSGDSHQMEFSHIMFLLLPKIFVKAPKYSQTTPFSGDKCIGLAICYTVMGINIFYFMLTVIYKCNFTLMKNGPWKLLPK